MALGVLLGLWAMGPMQEVSWPVFELLLWSEEEVRCSGIQFSASTHRSPTPSHFLYKTTPEATKRTPIDHYEHIPDGDPETERRQKACPRSQDDLAKEQSLKCADAHLVCYPPWHGVPASGFICGALLLTTWGRTPGTGFVCLTVPMESHRSQDFLPTSSFSASAPSAPCVLGPEVLLSGLAWFSLPLTFGIIILASLGCWLSVVLSPTHKHGYMLLSGSLWVKPNKKHNYTQAFQLNTRAYSSASCHHPLAQRVQKRDTPLLTHLAAVFRVSRGESPPLS